MEQMPPPFESNRDREQLKLLEIFHYVMVGLAVGGMAFVAMHYLVMSTVMESMAKSPKFQQQLKQQGGPDPTLFFHGFVWFYVFMGAWGLFSLVANAISGLCIRARKHRFFSMLVAGFNCINMPFGTGLGVCTLIVLVRSTTAALYDEPPQKLDTGSRV
jgi:hypothetical protein